MANKSLWREADALARTIPHMLTQKQKHAAVSKLLKTWLSALRGEVAP